MKLNTVDLQEELQKLKRKDKRQSLLEEVSNLLSVERKKEEDIIKRLESDLEFDVKLVENFNEKNIYTLEEIKHICVKYRLRFLDSKHFKGEVPFEAILKIKSLEKKLNTSLSGFKIVAPKELFKLEDKDSDPLLFLQLSDNKFYFIHKWGGELNRFRATLALPLQSFMNMFWFLAAIAFVFSLLIPTTSIDVFAFLFVHSFIAICGICCLIVFMLRENFSNVEWDSKFFS